MRGMSNLGYRQDDFVNWGARRVGEGDGFGGPATPKLGPDGDEQVGLGGKLAIAFGVGGGDVISWPNNANVACLGDN